MTLSSDIVFKYIFGQEENCDILLDLVNAVLADKQGPVAVSLELKNPVNLRQTTWLKEMILDIKAIDQSGRLFDIEMQANGDTNFHNRSLAYWASTYASQLQKGDAYLQLRPTVCINFLDFNLLPDLKQGHNCFTIRHTEQPEIELTNHLSLHFIELGKPATPGSRLLAWMQMLSSVEPLEEDLMPPLLDNDAIFLKTQRAFQRCTEDEQLREIAIARKFYRMDILSQAETRNAAAEAKTAEAIAKASEAETKASEAETKASEAEAKASEAEAKAAEAIAKASEAQNKAAEANSRAIEAETKIAEAHAQAAASEATMVRAMTKAGMTVEAIAQYTQLPEERISKILSLPAT